MGSYFASSTWTPPAGIVSLYVAVNTNNYDGAGLGLIIYKNGVELKQFGNDAASSPQSVHLSMIDQANGTDTYDVYTATVSDASYEIEGSSNLTWFMGAVL